MQQSRTKKKSFYSEIQGSFVISLREVKLFAFFLQYFFKKKNNFLFLNGSIGAGKTTLIKKIGEWMKIKKPIVSSTFIILQVYKLQKEELKFVFIDAFRIDNSLNNEEWNLYIEKFQDNFVVIEWEKNIRKLINKIKKRFNSNKIWIDIDFFPNEENKRIFKIKIQTTANFAFKQSFLFFLKILKIFFLEEK